MRIFKRRSVGPTTTRWQPDAEMFEAFEDDRLLTIYGLADLSGMRRSDVEFLLRLMGVPYNPLSRMVRVGDLRNAGLIPPKR